MFFTRKHLNNDHTVVVAENQHPKAGQTTNNEPSKCQKKSPEDDLICPITLELPWDPVVAEDGRVYEGAAIEEHFKGQCYPKSPMTNEKMGKHLLSSPHIKSLIETLVEDGVISEDLASKWNEKVQQQKDMEDLLKKAEGGDSDAMYSVAVHYDNDTDGFKEDAKLALKWYKKAHKAGDVMGTALLGYFLCNGLGGVATCHTTGMSYISIAAAQGSNFAAYILGMALADGMHGMIVNVEEAIYWLEKAVGDCEHNHFDDEDKKQAQQKVNELKAAGNKNKRPRSITPE
jgi:TPR repeat protein